MSNLYMSLHTTAQRPGDLGITMYHPLLSPPAAAASMAHGLNIVQGLHVGVSHCSLRPNDP
jgi:hypothetical protein